MRYEFKPAFDRSFKKLSSERKRKAYEAIEALMNYFDGLAGLPQGLGLKNWKDDYWEIRSTLKDRIIFKLTDHVVFLFMGNHNDILKLMRRK